MGYQITQSVRFEPIPCDWPFLRRRLLVALIRAHQRRLEAVYRSMESAHDGEIAQLGKTPISALIAAGLLKNYYTCLETIFLRISQSFDNNLDAARRHIRERLFRWWGSAEP